MRGPGRICFWFDHPFLTGASRRKETGPFIQLSTNSQETGQERRQRLARAQAWLFALGYLVLITGSAVSVWVYRNAVQDDLGDAIAASTYNTKKYQDQLERYGGKANILATEIQQWFAGLWHGRHLAYTLAVLTLVVALISFYIAVFLPDFPPPHDDPAKSGDGPGT